MSRYLEAVRDTVSDTDKLVIFFNSSVGDEIKLTQLIKTIRTTVVQTSLSGAESMVGAFINTLPVRVQCKPTELLPWLQQLQAQQVEREQYSYTFLVDIQGWTEVPRQIPLFESLVVFENYPVDASLQQWQGNIEISSINAVERTNYPLTVVAGIAKELVVKFIYDRGRFSEDTIKRIIGHFQTLLQGIVVKRDRLISELSLLTRAEQQQLVQWNNTKVDYPSDRCIHELFELQVQKTPHAVAECNSSIQRATAYLH